MQENGRGASGTRAACIDAETLAAWADGGLSSSDAAAVETHLADCDRCTAMLATFVRTAPEVPVAESLWKLRLRQGYGETSPKRSARRRGWHLRWLVPAATAATVAALYVLVPRPESQITTLAPAPTTESQALSSSAPATPATPSSALADAREPQAAAAPTQPADRLTTREESAPQTLRQRASERRADADETAKRLQAAPLSETIAAAPPPAPEADRAEAKSADAQSEQFSPQVPLTNAGRVAQSAPAETTGAAAAPPPAAAASESAFSAAGRVGAVASPASGVVSVLEVVSPDPKTRWRVIGAGQVERSTNGGTQWERATLPESVTLTGGSSPSPTVCWLVGRAGAIYVTTDGLRFARVPFPDRPDFVSIQAIDGRRATVVTIDGRTMRTDDQGLTWIRVAP